ncbi:MAG TPA: glycosyl hydrolase family 79 C-terminal domain-containing protein [Terracidiphilus sp.]|nr:glycosyl hydrolase family 79 C-terminal domain-containing protein [Terracidiphilus sp.]
MHSLRLAPEPPVEVPADFIGLGYEMSSVATRGLLSTTNGRYLRLVQGLGPKGVLRVGGIVADYARYLPNGPAARDAKNTVITRAAIEELAAFLRATGWRAIWSVNFAQGTIEQAIAEARAASQVLGNSLLALELGNEVENYGKSQLFRAAPYTYEIYRKEFDEWRSAIVQAVPGICFAGPDTAQSVEWVERMANDAAGKIQLLTTHYYRNGQHRGSVQQLLSPDQRLADVLARMRTASLESGIPWRMCEINSFSGGGLPGVSDTFIGAIWTLNTMLLLAQNGCSGVNMETGVNQLGFISSYSPIQDDGNGVNSAGPPYYGMLAFAQGLSGCHQMLPLVSSDLVEGVSAYVFGARGKPRNAVIVNMSLTNTDISLAGLGIDKASVLRLTAPERASKTGVNFGGAAVDSNGNWKPKMKERLLKMSVQVPSMTAVVVRADGSLAT